MTGGNVAALTQGNMKRMLAYSSVAQGGYVLSASSPARRAGSPRRSSTCSPTCSCSSGRSRSSRRFATARCGATSCRTSPGLYRTNPATALAMLIFMLSLGGIPPTAGFMAKLSVFGAAVDAGYIGLAVIGVLNSALSLYYYVRVVVFMWATEPGAGANAGEAVAGNGRGAGRRGRRDGAARHLSAPAVRCRRRLGVDARCRADTRATIAPWTNCRRERRRAWPTRCGRSDRWRPSGFRSCSRSSWGPAIGLGVDRWLGTTPWAFLVFFCHRGRRRDPERLPRVRQVLTRAGRHHPQAGRTDGGGPLRAHGGRRARRSPADAWSPRSRCSRGGLLVSISYRMICSVPVCSPRPARRRARRRGEPAVAEAPQTERRIAADRVLTGAKVAGRYALLAFLAYVMIARLRLPPLGLLAGASSIVAAVSLEALRYLLKKNLISDGKARASACDRGMGERPARAARTRRSPARLGFHCPGTR